MEKDKINILLNTLTWGFLLWLFGYILGIILFAFVPKDAIGWYILPFGIILTLLVLFKKIHRKSFGSFIALGAIWTIMAIALDYVFLVLLFQSNNYYKFDVYLYYALTFFLPVIIGWYKISQIKK